MEREAYEEGQQSLLVVGGIKISDSIAGSTFRGSAVRRKTGLRGAEESKTCDQSSSALASPSAPETFG